MSSSALCPICADAGYENISPLLHKCRACGVVFNSGYSPVPYEEDYFTDAYREQYGKTYREDLDNISRISSARLDAIAGLLGKREPGSLNLLDVGSALGIFLKCARERGIGHVLGIEVSRYASERAREDFQVETVNTSFGDFATDRCFDVITAWYVIEHTERPAETLKKMHALLCGEGIMGISVPSYFGPRYFFSRERWVGDFPGDHRVEFSPRSITRLLKNVGFSRVVVKPAGIHPDRIISKNSLLFPLFAPLYRFFSKILRFSDTMEVYAVKGRGQM